MKNFSFALKGMLCGALLATSVSASAAEAPALSLLDAPVALLDTVLSETLGLSGLSNAAALLPLDAAGAQSAFELTGALLNPQTLFELGSGIGLPLVQNLLPPVQILTTDPAKLATFLTDGGSLITSTIVLLPEIPLISAPLPGL